MAMLNYISYSRIDGLDFALNLYNELVGGHPSIPVWIDKYQLKPGQAWDDAIRQALAASDTVLYVMTLDSTNERSHSRAEIAQAQHDNKLIIPLVVDPGVKPPPELEGYKSIDFTKDFRIGLALLRGHFRQLVLEAQTRLPHFTAEPSAGREEPSVARSHLGSKRVFISYAHKDKKWLDRLHVHFKPFEREGLLTIWEDTQISPGSLWESEIADALNSAQVAVLLISADFLASEFIINQELPNLLTRAESEGTVIMPLIIGASRFAKTPSLSRFQAVNPPSRPLARLPAPRREEYFDQLAEAVADALRER